MYNDSHIFRQLELSPCHHLELKRYGNKRGGSGRSGCYINSGGYSDSIGGFQSGPPSMADTITPHSSPVGGEPHLGTSCVLLESSNE